MGGINRLKNVLPETLSFYFKYIAELLGFVWFKYFILFIYTFLLLWNSIYLVVLAI